MPFVPPIPPRRRLRAGLAAAAAGLLASCATPPWQAPGPAESETRPSERPGRLKPMPVRPLAVRADCRHRDETGYEVAARLDVRNAEVRAFAASVSVPRRGSCRFDGPFIQTRRSPSVQLRAADGCEINIWEQAHQVTIGFAGCASRCSRGTYDYVYPIIIDRRSGQCH